MEAVVSVQTSSRALVSVRGHQILCDQPVENGGEDLGMTPTELLAGALAACASYYAAQYLAKREMSLEGLSVKAIAEKASSPARIGSFHLELNTPPLGERHREPLLRAVKSCVVHNTLTHGPSIELSLKEAAPEQSIQQDT